MHLQDSALPINETQIYLTEENFKDNFKNVFGVDQPFFGKLLYIWMARGYDKAKISLLRFLECLYPLWNMENRFNHNKIIFQILDLDRDGGLNIINLLHLQRNLSAGSLIGQDVIKLIQFFITNFLSKKNLQSTLGARQVIDYELFVKIIGRSCLIDQLRNTFFGQPRNNKGDLLPLPPNVFEEREGFVLANTHMFKDVSVLEDVSYGQRGYLRNQEGLLNFLKESN